MRYTREDAAKARNVSEVADDRLTPYERRRISEEERGREAVVAELSRLSA